MLIGTAAFVGVFFAVVLRKVLRVRRMPPAQGVETIVGRGGVAIGAGLNPDGIVRVSSEEWRATSADGSTIPAGAPVQGHPPRRSRAHRRSRRAPEHEAAAHRRRDEGRNHR